MKIVGSPESTGCQLPARTFLIIKLFYNLSMKLYAMSSVKFPLVHTFWKL